MMYLAIGLLVAVPVVLDAQSKSVNTNTNRMETMIASAGKNKAIVRRLYEESFNKRNLALLDELISPEYVGAGGSRGPQGFGEVAKALVAAFPDIQWKLQELLAEDDKVFVWWKVEGKHSGVFQGIVPTGNTISSDGMAVYTLTDGLVTKARVFTDRLNFLQQLEVLPADISTLANRKNNAEHVQFIDSFIIPKASWKEFAERVKINRSFIKTLPGFIEDVAYERTDEQGNIHYITVAVWQNETALKQAKEAVQTEYKQQGFNPAEFMTRLKVTMDRGIYTEDLINR